MSRTRTSLLGVRKPLGRYPWLRAFVAQNRALLIGALALGVINIACSALLMFASGALIGMCAQPETTLVAIMMPIAFVQLFGLCKPASRYIERLISHDWVFRATSDLRRALYAAAEENEDLLIPARKNTTGDYLGLLAEDIGHLQNLFLRVGLPWAIAIVATVLVSIAFGIYTPWFGCSMLCALVTAALLVPLGILLASRVQALREKQLVGEQYNTLLDTIVGARDWMLSGRMAECRAASLEQARALGSARRRLRQRRRFAELVVKLLFGVLVLAVIWWASVRFASTNANLVIAFAIGFMPLIDAFIGLPDAAQQYHAHADALERLDHALASDPPSHATASPAQSVREEDAVVLAEASFAYPDGTQVLDRVSVSIPAGQKVALLGRSGAGKSTLLALIRDAFPTATCGTIEQNAHVFDTSLRENITLNRAGFSDDQVADTLERVGLGGLIESREGALDMPVGESGMRLSGGQRQRVALARILLSDTPIVLLDEPTQSLDPQTEHELMDSLLKALEGKTVIMATHHLQEIDRFDRIMFLENGRIALDGSPSELTANSPYFRELLALG